MKSTDNNEQGNAQDKIDCFNYKLDLLKIELNTIENIVSRI
jgi:hypothetical protein